MTFSGAKLALFLGTHLLVIQRDDRPDIPYPGHWDLPGGGREGGETPAQCALRETDEEVGLRLSEKDLVWANRYTRPRGIVWFFAAHLDHDVQKQIKFGDEGQRWALMEPSVYCRDPLAVPHFVDQLQLYMDQDVYRFAQGRHLGGKAPRE
ncbi:MAG: NUDIX hydrolase [Sedimentitalea sp.]